MERFCCDLEVDVNGEETFMVEKVSFLSAFLFLNFFCCQNLSFRLWLPLILCFFSPTFMICFASTGLVKFHFSSFCLGSKQDSKLKPFG